MLNVLIRPKLHNLEYLEPARIQRLQVRLRKHAMHAEHPLDRHVEPGFLLDLANPAILKARAECEMPAGQAPTPWSVRHPGRAPQHQNPPAIRNHAMDAHI